MAGMQVRFALGASVLALVAPTAVFAADAPAIVVQSAAAGPVSLAAEDLEQLPHVTVSTAFQTGQGPRQAVFEGPLLWSVLERAHAVDAAKASDQVRRVVVLTGSDGYAAVLGLGEVSPDFEGKQVVLAEQMDGKPLGMDHLRAVVAGDRRAGRSVRDVVRIDVESVRPPKP